MSSVAAVCTDSSAQLGAAPAAAFGIGVVPVGIAFDGEPFVDETDLDVDRFYDRLASGAAASTSLPSPGRFEAAYRAAAAAGAREIVSIHLDARVSSTVAAARLAARTAPVPVTVIDAGTASYGVALAAVATARALGDGMAASEAAALVERLVPQLRNVFMAGGDERGRVPRRAGFPLLSFAAGATGVVGECEGAASAVEAMEARIRAEGLPAFAAVGHARRSTEAPAAELAERLRRAGVGEVCRYRVGPSVGAHTGPFSFGAFWSREPIPGVAASDLSTDLQSSPRRVA